MKMNAMTACPARSFWCRAYCAEQTVWRMKNTSIPPAEVRKSVRRPMRSTAKEAAAAQNKFQTDRILERMVSQ